MLFLQSFFIQPNLFIRIWKGHEFQVKQMLTAAGIVFKVKSEQCLALPNGTKLDQFFPEQRYFEIQDESSQQTAYYFRPQKWETLVGRLCSFRGKNFIAA